MRAILAESRYLLRGANRIGRPLFLFFFIYLFIFYFSWFFSAAGSMPLAEMPKNAHSNGLHGGRNRRIQLESTDQNLSSVFPGFPTISGLQIHRCLSSDLQYIATPRIIFFATVGSVSGMNADRRLHAEKQKACQELKQETQHMVQLWHSKPCSILH